MTDKELNKLKRTELLELMLYMREEIENLQKENEELKRKISDIDINRKMLEKIMKAVCHDDETQETEKPESEVKAEQPTEHEVDSDDGKENENEQD